jgi:hypothetical protein
MMSRMLYHCATAIGLAKLYKSELKIGLASGSGTVVEHAAHYSEVKGISLTTFAITGREFSKNVIKTSLKSFNFLPFSLSVQVTVVGLKSLTLG